MCIARMICSDEACADESLADARTLEELDLLACDCGCALAVIGSLTTSMTISAPTL